MVIAREASSRERCGQKSSTLSRSRRCGRHKRGEHLPLAGARIIDEKRTKRKSQVGQRSDVFFFSPLINWSSLMSSRPIRFRIGRILCSRSEIQSGSGMYNYGRLSIVRRVFVVYRYYLETEFLACGIACEDRVAAVSLGILRRGCRTSEDLSTTSG